MVEAERVMKQPHMKARKLWVEHHPQMKEAIEQLRAAQRKTARWESDPVMFAQSIEDIDNEIAFQEQAVKSTQADLEREFDRKIQEG